MVMGVVADTWREKRRGNGRKKEWRRNREAGTWNGGKRTKKVKTINWF